MYIQQNIYLCQGDRKLARDIRGQSLTILDTPLHPIHEVSPSQRQEPPSRVSSGELGWISRLRTKQYRWPWHPASQRWKGNALRGRRSIGKDTCRNGEECRQVFQRFHNPRSRVSALVIALHSFGNPNDGHSFTICPWMSPRIPRERNLACSYLSNGASEI